MSGRCIDELMRLASDTMVMLERKNDDHRGQVVGHMLLHVITCKCSMSQ